MPPKFVEPNHLPGLSAATQATGQTRPNVGQLPWPITVPITGMLRQFPGAGNFFSTEKTFGSTSIRSCELPLTSP